MKDVHESAFAIIAKIIGILWLIIAGFFMAVKLFFKKGV